MQKTETIYQIRHFTGKYGFFTKSNSGWYDIVKHVYGEIYFDRAEIVARFTVKLKPNQDGKN